MQTQTVSLSAGIPTMVNAPLSISSWSAAQVINSSDNLVQVNINSSSTSISGYTTQVIYNPGMTTGITLTCSIATSVTINWYYGSEQIGASGTISVTNINSNITGGTVDINKISTGNSIALSPGSTIGVTAVPKNSLVPPGAPTVVGAYLAYIPVTTDYLAIINSVTQTNSNNIDIATTANYAMVIDPFGKYGYITQNNAAGTVTVFDIATGAVTTTITVGANPQGLAISPDGGYVYVCNSGSNSVSVIDTATNTVSTTVTVASSPKYIDITPDGLSAYVSQYAAASVSQIDLATNAVVATVAVGTDPAGLCITPNGSYVYVANSGSGTVSVIETATNAVVATIAVQTTPYYVSVTPNGNYVYVANTGSSSVSEIQVSTNAVVATLSLSGTPTGLAISPDNASVYVSVGLSVEVYNVNSNVLDITISGSAGDTYNSCCFLVYPDPYCYQQTIATVLGETLPSPTISVPNGGVLSSTFYNSLSMIEYLVSFGIVGMPFQIISNSAGSNVFVGESSGNGDLLIVDTVTLTILHSVAVGDCTGLLLSPDETTLYIGTLNGFSILNLSTLAITPIPVSNGGLSITMSPDGSYVYVAGYGNNYVVYEVSSASVIYNAAIGYPFYSMVVTQDNKYIFAVSNTNYVYVVDLATNVVVTTIALDNTYNYSVVLSPDGSYVYVLSYEGILSKISVSTQSLITYVHLANGGSAPVAITPDGAYIYAGAAPNMYVVDSLSMVITESFPVGAVMSSCVSGDGSHLFVGVYSPTTFVSVFRLLTGSSEFTVKTYRNGLHIPSMDTSQLSVLDIGAINDSTQPPIVNMTGLEVQTFDRSALTLFNPVQSVVPSVPTSLGIPQALIGTTMTLANGMPAQGATIDQWTLAAAVWYSLYLSPGEGMIQGITINAPSVATTVMACLVRANGQIQYLGSYPLTTSSAPITIDKLLRLMEGDQILVASSVAASVNIDIFI